MKLFLSTLMLLLCACANQSAYQPARGNGLGYLDTVVSDTRYKVQFKARGNKVAQAEEYALLRASELTIAQGYDWFMVLDRHSHVSTHKSHAPEILGPEVSRRCGLLNCQTTIHSTPRTDFSTDTKTQVILEIQMGKGIRPASNKSYDAIETRETLGLKAH